MDCIDIRVVRRFSLENHNYDIIILQRQTTRQAPVTVALLIELRISKETIYKADSEQTYSCKKKDTTSAIWNTVQLYKWTFSIILV